MAAVGGNQEITVRCSAIGKPRGNAVGVLFHVAYTLAKLHLIASPVIEHFALQLCARYRARATTNPLNQRCQAKLRQGFALAVIFIGHKAHWAAVSLHHLAHTQMTHAFHAVGPDGNRRTDGFDLFYRLKDVTRDACIF